MDDESDMAAQWPGAHALMLYAPVVSTGDDNWDLIFLFAYSLVAVLSILTVGGSLFLEIKRYRERNPRAGLPRALWLFLALAVVALWITSGLRYEHKRLQWLVQTRNIDLRVANLDVMLEEKELTRYGTLNKVDARSRPRIQYLYDHMKNITNRGLKDIYKDGNNTIYKKPYEEGVNRRHEKDARPRHREKLWRQAVRDIRKVEGRLPYFSPPNWPATRNSTWDYADMMVDTPFSFYWMGQWSMGFVAWMLYVVIECNRRKALRSLAVAFIGVAGCVSLATAQSLFFALLVLVPPARVGKVRVPRSWIAIFIAVAQAVSLLLWTLIRWNPTIVDDINSKLKNPYGQGLRSLRWRVYAEDIGEWFYCTEVPAAGVKCRSPIFWNAVAWISCVLYLYSIVKVWDETVEQERYSRFLGTYSSHPWFQGRNPLDHKADYLVQLLGVFGENLWINALAYDILLSAAALVCWSVETRLDARSMVKSSLSLWIDQIREKVKIMKYHTLPDAAANGGLRGGSTRSGAEYLLQDDALEGSSSSSSDSSNKPPWIKRRSHQTAQRKAKRTQSREPAPLPELPRRRGRPVRSASSHAASQQPEEPVVPERRRSRSADRQLNISIKKARSVSPRARAASAVRRSARIRDRVLSNDHELTETLLPDRPTFHERAGQAEQAGLTLALFTFGGLGMASAAVFAAEELREA